MTKFSVTVLRNSAFNMGAQLLIKLLSFGFSVLIVRQLGAETFGQYAAVLAFVAMFAILSDLGLSPYAVREVARWRDAPDGQEHIRTLYVNALMLRLLLSLLTIVLLVLAAWLTGRPLLMVGAIALNGLGLILYSIQGTSDAVLSGFERLDLGAKAKVFNQLAFVMLGALALWWGTGYYGLIIANLLSVAFMTYMCWRGVSALEVHPGHIVGQQWPALLRASLPFAVIGFALGLSYKFDSVLLNIFRSDAETGYYSGVYNLVFSAVIISNVLNTALYPSLARQAANAPDRLPEIYERSLRYLLMLALPIAVGGWALADQVVPFLFTLDYLPAVPALQILIWVVPLMFVSEFLGYVVVVAGKEKHVARSVLISTGFNVLLNLLLVPRYGFIAAAAMTVATEAILVSQYLWLLRSTTRQFNWGQLFLRPLVAALLMGGVALILHPYVPWFANAAICGIAYLLLLVVLGVIGRDEVRFVHRIVSPAATITQ
jgi:O-antigen/teichoic acid export membrane protein